jgi:hypothetical protein
MLQFRNKKTVIAVRLPFSASRIPEWRIALAATDSPVETVIRFLPLLWKGSECLHLLSCFYERFPAEHRECWPRKIEG